MSDFRGIQQKHEHAAQQVARDTRPLGTRISEFLQDPAIFPSICVAACIIMFVFPMAFDVILLLITCLFWFLLTRRYTLPFRLPESSDAYDYNDLKPGSTDPKKAGGISLFGNDRVTGGELWFTNDDLRTHVLIFGSTGSGKTEALVSFAFNSLVHGSGFIYVDGKGDNSLFAKVFSMVRDMGRDDDLLLINFMTGARDVIGAQKNRLSNTMNPFSTGSSSMLANLATSLMDGGGDKGGGGDMWKGRAISFIEALMKVLVTMRDDGHILLDANSIRNFFQLEKLEQIVVDKSFPTEFGYNVDLSPYPELILDALRNYLMTLPGYNPANKGNQAGEVREQHGFITMQLIRLFSSLADTYSHIIRTNLAEVDLKDVVLNRRILVVLLPALEKSPDELSNLGKIIIASLKSMMASGLGDSVEGDYRDVILRKPTNSPSPYVCIMDEYGYYAVPGFAVVPAQARSLGFSAIFAGQDLPAFQKASKEEAASICANTNVKICMKLEDPQETWEFFNKVAGEAYVTNVSGFQANGDSMTMNYMDSKNASVDRRARIDLLDLKDQSPGQGHVFFKSAIIRATMFYANPRPASKMRINHYLKIEPMKENEIVNLNQRLYKFYQAFNGESGVELPIATFNEDIDVLATAFAELPDNLVNHERGVSALISLLEHEIKKQQEINNPYEEEFVQDGHTKISIFTKVPTDTIVESMIGEENISLFTLPLLRRGSTTKEVKHIERLIGNSEEKADEITNNLILELEKATTFPPDIGFAKDVDGCLKDINAITVMLGGIPAEFSEDDEAEEFNEYSQGAEAHEGAEGEDFDKFSELVDLPPLENLPDVPSLAELDKIFGKESFSKEDFDEDFFKQMEEEIAKEASLAQVAEAAPIENTEYQEEDDEDDFEEDLDHVDDFGEEIEQEPEEEQFAEGEYEENVDYDRLADNLPGDLPEIEARTEKLSFDNLKLVDEEEKEHENDLEDAASTDADITLAELPDLDISLDDKPTALGEEESDEDKNKE